MLGRMLSHDSDWPITLREDAHGVAPHGVVVLRPLERRDEAGWTRLRAANAHWLAPWEATDPAVVVPQITLDNVPHPRAAPLDVDVPGLRPGLRPIMVVTFRTYLAGLRRAAREGHTLPFAIEYDGELVGQLMVTSIVYGAQRSGVAGYWVSEHVAGRGIAPTAVAMAIDHCFDTLLLHRIELCIRPENHPSQRVAVKLGLRAEGLRPRYIHIAGQWRDHLVFAVTPEEVPEPGGMLARLHRTTRM